MALITLTLNLDGGNANPSTSDISGSFELDNTDITNISNQVKLDLTPDMEIIKGLMQRNFHFTNQTYDNGRLKTGQIKIYPTGTDLINNTNELMTLLVAADYDTNGNLIDYGIIQQGT